MDMGMFAERVAAVQALIVGALFLWAGIWKVFFPAARQVAAQSALAKVLGGSRRAQTAHLVVGVGEIAVAALLLLPPSRWWAMRLATVFAVGFVGYLGLAWRIAPDRPCGCMGGRATKFSRRSLARAGTLLMLTLIGWASREFWGAALLAAPWSALLITAEVLTLWLLSPEFGWTGARFEKRLIRWARLRLDPSCTRIAPNWDELEHGLWRTAAFQELVRRGVRVGTSTDRWREGCWGYIACGASYEDRPATVVFAIPILFDARQVSAAVVDEAENAVVLRLAPARTARGADPAPPAGVGAAPA